MITLYTVSWNLNAPACGTPPAGLAAALLRAEEFEVLEEPGLCQNENCGCECDTDEELAAIERLSGTAND